jgi:predicted small lipoprotein YifL
MEAGTMPRQRVLAILLVAVLVASAAGCGPKTAVGDPPAQQQQPSPFALDFSVAPTQVTTKQFGASDPATSESPAFKQGIVWPRLASLLTLAVWGSEWTRLEKIGQLPPDVDKVIHGTTYLDPSSAAVAGQWIDVTFGRERLTVPSGFTGTELRADEIALYAATKDAMVDMYLKSGPSWLRCATSIDHDDLDRYVQAVRKANAPD